MDVIAHAKQYVEAPGYSNSDAEYRNVLQARIRELEQREAQRQAEEREAQRQAEERERESQRQHEL